MTNRYPAEVSVPALEIGGTHVSAALVDLENLGSGPTVHRRDLDASGSAEEIVDAILDCARTIDPPDDSVWGVALPGPFDYERGIGLFEGVAKFESLYGYDLGKALRDGLPTASKMYFLNDAQAFLLGEWVSGAASGHGQAVGITVGTGIGSAFLTDGRIVTDDPAVPPSGYVYQLLVDDRPLEELVSRRALLSRYAELSPGGLSAGTDVKELAEQARTGDEVAARVFSESFTALGGALAPWLERFGATVLVVGGSISRAWDLIEGPLRKGIEDHSGDLGRRILIALARHPDAANLIGAAYHARRSWGEGQPSQ